MPSISAREIRANFSSQASTSHNGGRTPATRYGVCLCGRLVDEHFDHANRKRTCEELASAIKRRRAASSSERVSTLIALQSLTITPDVMPHHHVARAVILDLEPSQMAAAILATEQVIKQTHRRMFRTGWKAASDGLTIYFHAHVWGEYARVQNTRDQRQ